MARIDCYGNPISIQESRLPRALIIFPRTSFLTTKARSTKLELNHATPLTQKPNINITSEKISMYKLFLSSLIPTKLIRPEDLISETPGLGVPPASLLTRRSTR